MKLNLQIAYDVGYIPTRKLFEKWINATLPQDRIDIEITIRIVGKDESQDLNNRYRNKNKPTNILSFPFEPLPHVDMNLLGDIVICAPIVNEEAKKQNKTAEGHWAHIVVHGILHLLGYDHGEEMEQLEVKILKEIGFGNPY